MEPKNHRHTFYITTVNKLFILVVKEGQVAIKEEFELNGTCTEIHKIKDVLYLGCTYERLSYVMELQVTMDKSSGN